MERLTGASPITIPEVFVKLNSSQCEHLDNIYMYRSQVKNGLKNRVSYITLHNNYILYVSFKSEKRTKDHSKLYYTT